MSVTLVYCIQTAEDRPGSPIILVFFNLPAPILNSNANPSAEAQNTRGWGKFAIFDRNRRLSGKEIDP